MRQVIKAVGADRRPSREGRASSWLAALLLGVAVTSLYASASWNIGFIYDDEPLVVDQSPPRSVRDFLRVFAQPHYGALPYYRPIPRATYLAQKVLHGDAPYPYHLFNAMLAGSITVAAWRLLAGPLFRGAGFPALLAAAGVALHPAASSCVYQVAGRETLLPVLFGLLCVAAHTREGPAGRVLAAVTLALALFSKEHAVAVPLLILFVDAGTGAAAGGSRRWIVRYGPLAAVMILYFAARSAVLAEADPLQLALVDDPIGPLKSLGYGLQTAVAPFVDLRYEPRTDVWLSWPRLLVALAATGLMAALAAGRRELRRPVYLGMGWLVLAQLPTMNIFRQETLFDERYVFLGVFGVAAAAAASASALPTKVRAATTALWVVALAGISVHRAAVFADPFAFSEMRVRSNPNSAGAQNNFGVLLDRAGRTEEAINHLEAARASSPRFPEASYNLGNALARVGRLDEAATAYRRALALRPGYIQAHNNYGGLLVRIGRPEEAMAEFLEVLRLDPSHPRARLNLGILLARSGRLEEAIEAYRDAIRLDPASPDARFNMGSVLHRLGRSEEAIASFREALRLRPDFAQARVSLAWILATNPLDALRDGAEAVDLALAARQSAGTDAPEILDILAAAYAEAGLYEEAIATAERALARAGSQGRVDLAAEIDRRLKLYRAGRPYREPVGTRR